MKCTLTKNGILNTYFYLFLLILIGTFIKSIITGYSKESWQITEFLINYEGGFVRRGLFGEIILYLYRLTGISPYIVILLICISAYIFLVWFFVSSFIKKGYGLFILPFVFFLGNPIIHNFWVRKDVLNMLLFIPTIYLAQKKKWTNLIGVNVFMMFALLIHEGTNFFFFPIVLLILYARNKRLHQRTAIQSILLAFLQLLPAILTFLTVLYFNGSPGIAAQIWASWQSVPFPIQENSAQLPGAIDGLSWSLEQGLSLSKNTLENFNDSIYAPLAWGFILIVIYYILTNTHKLNDRLFRYKGKQNINKQNCSNVLIFQFLTIIPLFILGWDYCRWIFYWTISSFAILLLVSEKNLSALFPKVLSAISTKINGVLDLFPGSSSVLVWCLLLGFPAISWSLSDALNSSSLIYIVQKISKALYQLFFI